MNLFDVGVSVIIEFARVVIVFLYFKIFFEDTEKIKHIFTCAVSFFVTTGGYLFINNSIVNIISTIIGVIIISSVFEGKIKSKVLLSILCCSLMIIIDFAAYYIIIKKDSENVNDFFASLLSVLLFYMVVMLLRVMFRKRMKTEFIGQWYILLVVSVMSVCLLIVIYRTMTFSAYGIIYISAILLALNFFLYIFYTNMLDSYIYFKENEYLKQQMNFYEQQIKDNIPLA